VFALKLCFRVHSLEAPKKLELNGGSSASILCSCLLKVENINTVKKRRNFIKMNARVLLPECRTKSYYKGS